MNPKRFIFYTTQFYALEWKNKYSRVNFVRTPINL